MTAEVELDLSETEHWLYGLAGAAQDRADAGEELFYAKRLREVVVGAKVQSIDFVTLSAPGGKDDHGQFRPAAELAKHLEAVDLRHHQVQNNPVRRARRERREGLFAARGELDLVAVRRESGAQRAANLGLVVDHQDALSGH